MLTKLITDRGIGAEPPSGGGYKGQRTRPQKLGDFLSFFEKTAVLTRMDNILQVFREPFKRTRFLTFESQLKT